MLDFAAIWLGTTDDYYYIHEQLWAGLASTQEFNLLFNLIFPVTKFSSIVNIYNDIVTSTEIENFNSFEETKTIVRKIVENSLDFDNYSYTDPEVKAAGGRANLQVKNMIESK